MEVFGYRKLVAYQKAKEVVKMTYKLIKKFPSDERYAMCDQLRRASVQHVSSPVFKNLINKLIHYKKYTLNSPLQTC